MKTLIEMPLAMGMTAIGLYIVKPGYCAVYLVAWGVLGFVYEIVEHVKGPK